MKRELLRIQNLNKSYHNREVFRHLCFDVFAGERVGILIPPLSGKTTLAGILKGEETFDGLAFFNGEIVHTSFKGLNTNGEILCLTQKSTLIPTLTLGENMFLNPNESVFSPIRRKQDQVLAQDYLDALDVGLSANTPARDSDIFSCHMIRLAYAIEHGLKLVLLDDPSTYYEREHLDAMGSVLEKLHDRGIAVVWLYATEFPLPMYLLDRVIVIEDYQKARTIFHPVFQSMTPAAPPHKSFKPGSRSYSAENPAPALEIRLPGAEGAAEIALSLSKGQAIGISAGHTHVLQSFGRLFSPVYFGLGGTYRIAGKPVTEKRFHELCGVRYTLLGDYYTHMQIMADQSILDNVYLPLCRVRKLSMLSFNDGYRKSLQQEIEANLGYTRKEQEKRAGDLSILAQQELILFRTQLMKPAFVVYVSSYTQLDMPIQECLIRSFGHLLRSGSGLLIAAPKLNRFQSLLSAVYDLDSGELSDLHRLSQ